MITAYHRPQSLDEALRLITRRVPATHPLGGGTLLSHGGPEPIEVVDLQFLGLNGIKPIGKILEIGATVSLQGLLEHPAVPSAMQLALRLEAPLNLRNSATVAGTIVVADGRSTLTCILLALDAKVTVMTPKPESLDLGDFLPSRARFLPGILITAIQIPTDAKLAFEYVSRTPVDKPIVCAALAQWQSGRTRLALGGYGAAPLLAMDGTEAEGLELAASNAFHEATDPWGSAEYRMDVAATLARRCLHSLKS